MSEELRSLFPRLSGLVKDAARSGDMGPLEDLLREAARVTRASDLSKIVNLPDGAIRVESPALKFSSLPTYEPLPLGDKMELRRGGVEHLAIRRGGVGHLAIRRGGVGHLAILCCPACGALLPGDGSCCDFCGWVKP